MTTQLFQGDCLKLMKTLPDASVDLFICDLPYTETNLKWDIAIDLEEFWKEFRRLRKSPNVACLHFCSTKFGYKIIKSWEKGFRMDMVWKKRNKTGGLQSRYRPMRNHEMIYFFYEKSPKYNRDRYHKRIKKLEPIKKTHWKERESVGHEKFKSGIALGSLKGHFEPIQPASVLVEEKIENKFHKDYEANGKRGMTKTDMYNEECIKKFKQENGAFKPKLPVSVVHELETIEEDEPLTMFESNKCFIGKRHHSTEKPQDILEFFIKYWSDEEDTILDPTMGSGSTGVACKNLKRNFIGFELTEQYFKVAQTRMGQENSTEVKTL